jgi:hypothetical protein
MREAINETRTAYQHAKEAVYRAKDLDIPGPDGHFALNQALIGERRAFREYWNALDDFNRLILDGKLPGEPDD